MPKKIKAIHKYQLASGREKYEFSIRANKNKIIHKRGFNTYDEAQLEYLNVKQEIINGDIESELQRIKYKDLYQQWLKRYANTVKDSTLQKTKTIFKLHILPRFGDKYVDAITIKDCQAAVDFWAEKMVKYKFIYNYSNHVFKDAVRLKYIKKSPMDSVDVPKTTKHIKELRDQKNDHNFYSKQQLEQFLKTAKAFMPFQIYAFFRLLAYSGMRKGEILALTWEDINFKEQNVRINKTVSSGLEYLEEITSPKSEASIRTIVMDEATLAILKQWQQMQREYLQLDILPKDQVVFQNQNNQHYALPQPRKWLMKIAKLAHLPVITVHGFRHTHATLLYDENPQITIKDVQKRLGHSDANVTMNIYEHATDNSDQKIIDAINSFDQKSAE